MEPLLEKRTGIVRTEAMSGAQALALAGDARRLIVRLLYKKSMTISEIAAAAVPEGAKGRMSVNHHVNVLRDAGVVEVVKIVPVRGTVEKHYTATTRMLGHGAPEDFGEAHSSEIAAAARRMEKLLEQLAPRIAGRSPEGGGDPEYEQFVLAEIINRAMTRVLEARDAGEEAGGGGAPAAGAEAGPPRRSRGSRGKGKGGKAPAGKRD